MLLKLGQRSREVVNILSVTQTLTQNFTSRESRSINAKLSMRFQSETISFKRPNFKSKHLTCDPKTNKDKWVITSPVLNVSQPYLTSRTAMSLRFCRCSNTRTKTVISSKSRGEQFSLQGCLKLEMTSYSDSLEGIFQNSWLNLRKRSTCWTMTHFSLCRFMSAHHCAYLCVIWWDSQVCVCVAPKRMFSVITAG